MDNVHLVEMDTDASEEWLTGNVARITHQAGAISENIECNHNGNNTNVNPKEIEKVSGVTGNSATTCTPQAPQTSGTSTAPAASANDGQKAGSSQDIDTEEKENIFGLLPPELVQKIFSHFSTSDLVPVSLVCKTWQVHASNPKLWTKIKFLHNCDITAICRVLEQRPSIREVSLVGLENLTADELRQILTTCRQIDSLDLGFIPTIGRDAILAIGECVPKLAHLNVEGSKLIDTNCVTALINLKSLTSLNISHCTSLYDFHVQAIISNLPLLEDINLDGIAMVSDATLRILWQHCGAWLKRLCLDGAEITDQAMEYIAQCPEIHTLTISFGEALTDAGILKISALKKLRELKLKRCSELSAEAVTNLFKDNESLSKLQILDMAECARIDDTSLTAVAERCNDLKELRVCWCWDISDEGVQSILDNCPRLTILDLTGLKEIEGACFIDVPRKMPELKLLDLRQCNMIKDAVLREMVPYMPNLVAYDYYGMEFGVEACPV